MLTKIQHILWNQMFTNLEQRFTLVERPTTTIETWSYVHARLTKNGRPYGPIFHIAWDTIVECEPSSATQDIDGGRIGCAK